MEIKVSLTIELPGAIMWSKEECLKTTQKTIINKTKNGKAYKETINVQVEDWDKMDSQSLRVVGENGTETLIFHTRKCKTASEHVNISKEAYDMMVDKSQCPYGISHYDWKRMSRQARLDYHMSKIAENKGALGYDYFVFDD